MWVLLLCAGEGWGQSDDSSPSPTPGLTVQVGKTDQSLENEDAEWSGLGWETPEGRLTQPGGQGGLPGGGAMKDKL